MKATKQQLENDRSMLKKLFASCVVMTAVLLHAFFVMEAGAALIGITIMLAAVPGMLHQWKENRRELKELEIAE